MRKMMVEAVIGTFPLDLLGLSIILDLTIARILSPGSLQPTCYNHVVKSTCATDCIILSFSS
jgi:hypothetical protein